MADHPSDGAAVAIIMARNDSDPLGPAGATMFLVPMNATPAHPLFRTLLASAYALRGEIEPAAAELAEARRLVGDDRYSSIARLRAVVSWGAPKDLVDAAYFAGLRKAGLPESD
jgi:hypothetical protein